MQRKLDVLLWEVTTHAESIVARTADRTLVTYGADDDLQLIVERKFTILGEALIRVRDYFPKEYQILTEAQEIVHFRNRLVHLYDTMRVDQVWRVITERLPVLVEQARTMLGEQNL